MTGSGPGTRSTAAGGGFTGARLPGDWYRSPNRVDQARVAPEPAVLPLEVIPVAQRPQAIPSVGAAPCRRLEAVDDGRLRDVPDLEAGLPDAQAPIEILAAVGRDAAIVW